MKKLFLYTLTIVLITACNNEKADNTSSSKKTGSQSTSSVADSYTADTMYQALPQLLQDLSGSNNMEDLLAQNWINIDDIDGLKDAEGGTLELPVRTFYLFTDKTIVKNVRNYMEIGTWSFDEGKKIITFNFSGSKDVYKIRALAVDELRLTNIGIGSETVLVFSSDGKRHKNAATDPFYKTNLSWRIAAKKSETDEAVKQRVKKYVEFFMLYYKDAIARRADVVSFYGFPGCIKWYAGGIYIQNEEEALEKWNALFFNKTQGEKGFNMVSKLLDKKYNWPTGNENWIKKNLAVLEQMYKNL